MMKNSTTTTMNETKIRDILCEYLGRRKAKKVAQMIYSAIDEETKHIHNSKEFFVREDEKGELVISMKSQVTESVKEILKKNLETPEDVDECFWKIMKERIFTETHLTKGIETIHVEGSNSYIYKELFKSCWLLAPAVKEFLDKLNEAISAGVKSFEVPVYDMTIDDKEKPIFSAGCGPTTDLSFNELKQLAKKNNLKLGTKHHYVLFLATLIERMKMEGWEQDEAVKAICCDSTEIGHYFNTKYAQDTLEIAGCRKVAGKCGLANVRKIFAEDETYSKVCIASGSFAEYGYKCPIAKMTIGGDVDFKDPYGVGWFVF